MELSELSHSQLNYIAAIDALKPLGATQTTISDFLNVKRPSVNVALKLLAQKNYVSSVAISKTIEYSLTEKGKAALREMQRERAVFFNLFYNHIGMEEEIVEEAYNRFLGAFPPSFTAALENFQNSGFKRLPTAEEGFVKRSVLQHYKNGVYTVPFQVRKLGDMSASMGDKGFLHPAKVILDAHTSELQLEARVFYYRSREGKMLTGYLKSLSYYAKNEWHEAEEREEHIFILPLKYILYQNNDLGHPELGQMKIQASASNKNMPSSIAEITFQFSLMEAID